MRKPAIQISLFILAILFGGCANINNSLAVKRGQAYVEKTDLPLVCIVFGTKNIGLPIQSVTFRNMTTQREQTFIVSKSIGDSNPDYLTAVSGDTMLCLLTLRLEPGDYLLEAVQYNSARYGRFDYTFNFTEWKKLKIHVLDGVVNYVGSVEFGSSWRPTIMPAYNSSVPYSENIPAFVLTKSTAERDRKWVYDLIPGMRELPSVSSEIVEIR